MRFVVAALFVALFALPVAAQNRPPDAATSQYQFAVTAGAAAWTDVTIAGMTAIGPRDAGRELTNLSCHNSDGSNPVRVLLRANAAEAASAGAYIPAGQSVSFPVGNANVTAVSFHGDGNTPTVYCVAGAI